MSIPTSNWEENWQDQGVLITLRDDLKQLEKDRDAYQGDKENETYIAILDAIESTEYRIEEFEETLGIN